MQYSAIHIMMSYDVSPSRVACTKTNLHFAPYLWPTCTRLWYSNWKYSPVVSEHLPQVWHYSGHAVHVGAHAMEDCTSMMDTLNKEHAPLGSADPMGALNGLDPMGALNGPLCYQINQYGVQHSYKIEIGVHDATYPGCS